MSVLVNGIAIEQWNKNNTSFVSNINVTKYIIIAIQQKKARLPKTKTTTVQTTFKLEYEL